MAEGNHAPHKQNYELTPLSQLTPHPENPRRGNVHTITESVKANGFYGAIVAQKSTGHVLAGNHRLAAAHEQGFTHIPVLWIDVDDDRARRILLVDNRSNDIADYNDTQLLTILQDLADTDLQLLGTGYTNNDLAELLPPPRASTDPDDAPEPPPEPITQPGDIWHLGPHKVLCGDSTDVTAVETMLNGDRADCMWTDPPYGVEYVGKTKESLTIQNDGADGLPELLAGAFAVATTVLNPGAPIYVAHADTARLIFENALHEAGWLLRQNLIWVKDTMALGRSDYHYRHEPILYGFTAPHPGSGRLGRGGERWYGDNSQTTVLEVPKPARNSDHPTMKPVELITRCLDNSCPPGGLVYEPFGGSGSTLIAAHTTNRKARVVELDPKYVDVICKRFQQHTGTLPVLASSGKPHSFVTDQEEHQ